MGIRWLCRAMGAAGAVSAVLAVALPGATAGQVESDGLWPTSFSTGQAPADCGRWRLDENGFCVADDARNGLEVGTRFRSTAAVQVTGVRIYRADPGTLHASLWEADGTLLARGRFPDRDSNGWQSMSFTEPVTIAPHRTYVVSYFTPATRYAFGYGYFTDSGRTVGPVTGLRALDGEPNGVHCYQEAPCDRFPVRGHRDSTYWVTPLWVDPRSGPGSPPEETPGDQPGVDTTAPRVEASVPPDRAARVGPRTTVRVSLSEAVRRATVDGSSVRLVRVGATGSVPAAVRVAADPSRIVLDPRSPLRRGATYRVQVTSAVRDLAGNRLDQHPSTRGLQPATWTFRVRR